MINIQLRSTRGYSVANGVKMLVYGRAGRGKTRLCSTCPNPVIFSAESGLLSLDGYDLPFYEIKSVAALRDVFQWCKTSHEAKQFETICLDSISEIAEVLLASTILIKKDPRQAYGEMITQMNAVLKDFRDLAGKHVYMSAKLETVIDAVGVKYNSPSMPGQKLGANMPYLPDMLFQAEINGSGDQAYYYLRCKPDFQNEAKDRSGILNEIEEPHLGKIIEKIRLGVRT